MEDGGAIQNGKPQTTSQIAKIIFSLRYFFNLTS